jgi:hypothetical protein
MADPQRNRQASPLVTWLSRFWIYLPILIVILIMLPRLASSQFGLMDDGRALSIAQGIVHGKWDLSWDVIAGRFRPIYWGAFAFWYLLVGGQAFWYFLGNLLVFTGSTFLLIRLVTRLGGSKLQGLLSGLVFVLSTSVIENIYTLSKAENFQLLLMLGAISLALLAARAEKQRRVVLLVSAAGLLLLVACLTKESTLLLLPIAAVWWGVAWVGRRRKRTPVAQGEKASLYLAIASLASGVIFYLGRTLFLSSSQILGVGQSSEFFFDPANLLNSLVRWGGWLLRDYLWLLPMLLAVLLACLVARRMPRSWLWWPALAWMAFWLGMYIPWHFAVEYYLLPFAAGTAVLSGVLLVELVELAWRSRRLWQALGYGSLALTGLLVLVSQANSFSDAAIQLAQDAANTRVLQYLAANAPQGSRVIVNLQIANEYIEQMQLSLANFYQRPDLTLTNYQGEDLTHMQLAAQKPYFLRADLANQPRMTVRMGLDQPSLQIWNASVEGDLASWQQVYQVSADPQILTVDFPRLLCAVIPRESYCAPGSGLVNYRQLGYQWTVYTP